MILVMVGAPGAGKGTQAQILAARLGIPHVASGELFRAAVRSGSDLGRTVAGYLEQGTLVPDKVTIAVILERLRESDAAGGAILDGFPRTRPQAEALDVALGRMGTRVAQALYVGVREAELRRRLSGRWLCRANDHIYHVIDRPPRRPGICDIDGAELYQRPTTARRRSRHGWPRSCRRCTRSSTTTPNAASSPRSTARGRWPT